MEGYWTCSWPQSICLSGYLSSTYHQCKLWWVWSCPSWYPQSHQSSWRQKSIIC